MTNYFTGPYGSAFAVRGHALWLEVGAASEARAVAQLERLGYSGLFMPTYGHVEPFEATLRLLRATESAMVATSILNVWDHDPADIARQFHRLELEHPGRFTLGIGIGHARFVDADHGTGHFRRPLEKLRDVLDVLEGVPDPVPHGRILLAAHGPKMLAVAAGRCGGTHPYLVTPTLTRDQRTALGEDHILVPEQKVLLETDPAIARSVSRERIALYLTLPSFRASLRRAGFDDNELVNGGSDRLIDALVAWGDEEAIATRVHEHLAAGATQVAIQVIGVPESKVPVGALRRLASVLADGQ